MSGSSYATLVAYASAVGGLLFGYEIGVIGDVLSNFQFNKIFGAVPEGALEYEKDAHAFLSSYSTFSFLLACALGALINSYFVEQYGRKKPILFGAILFLVGGVLQSVATGYATFVIGRIMSGLSIGILSMTVPLFISETSPAATRGRMTVVYQLMITIGILASNVINYIIARIYKLPTDRLNQNPLEWRLQLAVQCVPAFALMIFVFFLPESPRWLAEKGRNKEALDIICKLRDAPSSSTVVSEEYDGILRNVEFEKTLGNGSWSELFEVGIKNRLFISIANQIFQQWTGINIFFYFKGDLTKAMGLGEDGSYYFGLAFTFVNFIVTYPGMYLIDRVGRKKLLMWGGLGMGISLIMTSVLLKSAGTLVNENGTIGDANFTLVYLSLVFVIGFNVFFGSTWGPVVWTYQSEIFPLRLRGKGTSIATMANWLSGAILSYVQPPYIGKLGNDQYFIFGTICLINAVYTWYFIPETSGKSLEEMDELFGYDNLSAARAFEKAEAGKQN